MHITGLHIIVAIIILVNFFVYHVMATSTTDYDISAENFTNSNTTKSTEIGDVKKRRVKRFLSMRPGQRFLVSATFQTCFKPVPNYDNN